MFLLIIYTFTTFYVIFVFYVFVFFLYYQWVGICIVSFFVHGVGRVGSGRVMQLVGDLIFYCVVTCLYWQID